MARDSICHSCSRPVLWCLFPDKRYRPVDELETATGNVAVTRDLFGGTWHGAETKTATRYRLHIETCPQQSSWRERMKQRGIAAWKGTPNDLRPFSLPPGMGKSR